jgi:SRSO17 transposase
MTKPTLATGMITAALDAGVPAGWVAGGACTGRADRGTPSLARAPSVTTDAVTNHSDLGRRLQELTPSGWRP